MILSVGFSVCFVAMLIKSHAGPIVPTGLSRTDEVFEKPIPYGFQYKMDDGNGTLQHRQEISDENGEVRGQYGYTDLNGNYREVHYKAGKDGFVANIKSNEPGIVNQNSANVNYVS